MYKIWFRYEFIFNLAFTFYRKRDYEKAEKIIRELYDNFGHEIRNDRELKIRINKLRKKIMNKKNPYIQSST
jgi:5-methylthioribose kinase